jgi:hypothetical protein
MATQKGRSDKDLAEFRTRSRVQIGKAIQYFDETFLQKSALTPGLSIGLVVREPGKPADVSHLNFGRTRGTMDKFDPGYGAIVDPIVRVRFSNPLRCNYVDMTIPEEIVRPVSSAEDMVYAVETLDELEKWAKGVSRSLPGKGALKSSSEGRTLEIPYDLLGGI